MAILSHLVKGKESQDESLDGHFNERSSSRSQLLGAQIPSIQGFGASYFHVWHWKLGRWLEILSLEGFQEGHEDGYDVSRQSAFFDYLSYFTCKIWKTSHRIIHSQAYYELSTMACPPIPTWLVCKATSLSRYLAEQGFSTWHNLTTMWKTLWGLSHWGTPNNPTTSRIVYDDIKVAFLAKKWNSSIS